MAAMCLILAHLAAGSVALAAHHDRLLSAWAAFASATPPAPPARDAIEVRQSKGLGRSALTGRGSGGNAGLGPQLLMYGIYRSLAFSVGTQDWSLARVGCCRRLRYGFKVGATRVLRRGWLGVWRRERVCLLILGCVRAGQGMRRARLELVDVETRKGPGCPKADEMIGRQWPAGYEGILRWVTKGFSMAGEGRRDSQWPAGDEGTFNDWRGTKVFTMGGGGVKRLSIRDSAVL